jgi:molybdenum cofactor cytidylyltransferase
MTDGKGSTGNRQTTTAAIVLAAGTSSRYGANKLLLPFGDGAVVRQTVRTVLNAGESDVLVVTGHQRWQLEDALDGLDVAFVHNPRYAEGEMVSSIKAGLVWLEELEHVDAALIVLGDQPLLPGWVIQRVIEAYRCNCGEIVAPRFGNVRGHPVLIDRKWWAAARALPDGAPMRELLRAHPQAVAHLLVNTDAVIKDVDTPELYAEAVQAAKRDA